MIGILLWRSGIWFSMIGISFRSLEFDLDGWNVILNPRNIASDEWNVISDHRNVVSNGWDFRSPEFELFILF